MSNVETPRTSDEEVLDSILKLIEDFNKILAMLPSFRRTMEPADVTIYESNFVQFLKQDPRFRHYLPSTHGFSVEAIRDKRNLILANRKIKELEKALSDKEKELADEKKRKTALDEIFDKSKIPSSPSPVYPWKDPIKFPDWPASPILWGPGLPGGQKYVPYSLSSAPEGAKTLEQLVGEGVNLIDLFISAADNPPTNSSS